MELRLAKQICIQYLYRYLGLMLYGKDWKKVEESIKSRNCSQVRSHAQKFFQKITKMIKYQKKQSKKGNPSISITQNEFLKLFKKELISQNTPHEIISLLRVFDLNRTEIKEYDSNALRKKQIQKIIKEQERQQKKAITILRNSEDSYKLNQNLNQSNIEMKQQKLQHGIQEDQSYFMYFLRANIDHLSTDYNFSQFIDFGKTNITFMNYSPRKRSFQIPNQQYNQERLQQTLKSLRDYTKNQRCQ